MAPRNIPARGNPPRGGGNTPLGRGGTRGTGLRRGGAISNPRSTGASLAGGHVETRLVKRAAFGVDGQGYGVYMNAFEVSVPPTNIYHYDVVMNPERKNASDNLKVVKALQCQERDVFTSKAVYDGRKNLFAPFELPLGSGKRTFQVPLADTNQTATGRPPRVFSVTISHVATINPEVLEEFKAGQKSLDENVLTSIMALNVAIRMDPNLNFPFNRRCFFTPQETFAIPLSGIVLWRGIFQSVRPAIGRMIANIDLSTGMMYKPGPLINLCLDFLGKDPANSNPRFLATENGFRDQDRLRLSKFLLNAQVTIPQRSGERRHTIKGLTREGANTITFTNDAGVTQTVQQYFQSLNIPLRFPTLVCAQFLRGAVVPLELCIVPPGQIMRRQIPAEHVDHILKFSTKRPSERLESIRRGVSSLNYGNSEYLASFGMRVNEEPIGVSARVLKPPTLQFGTGGAAATLVPERGAWNMLDKRFFKPEKIDAWVILVYESTNRFPDTAIQDLQTKFLGACGRVGINVTNRTPFVKRENPQGNVADHLRSAGGQIFARFKAPPSLIVVVLPHYGNEIRHQVKHFGDVSMGVTTQCLRAAKCARANDQYWMNVMLKVNPKLGGINSIPRVDPTDLTDLLNPTQPLIVMGADVMHPPPGVRDRPSFTAVVCSVDSNVSKYVADNSLQPGPREMIRDLQSMCEKTLTMSLGYRANMEGKPDKPTRLFFFRDGVSEGEFEQVLDQELPQIKAACAKLGFNPKITLMVVGKRHHVQPIPKENERTDKSGNVPAGLVIDTDVVHPIDFDFYLCSHQGILGTSRPAHYIVLYDENNLAARPDMLQKFAFNLCHVYARATRSVSIPAPVYYADLICARAKNHYDPRGSLAFSDTASQASGATDYFESYRTGFKPIAESQKRKMYWM